MPKERNIALVAPSLAAAILAAAAGCTTSTVEGPQVTRVPPGYGFSSQLSGARNVFLDERPADEFGWVKSRGESHGSIEIDVWDRAFTADEVRAARDAHAERWEYATYDPVRETRIDGRKAYAWFVRQERSRECVAVVPYDDATYTIEYYSAFRDEQDDARMLEVVRSFRRAPGRFAKVLVPLAFVAGIAALLVAVRRARR